VPLSVVCFRWAPAGRVLSADALDSLNAQLLDAVNDSGEVFLSHTKLNGSYVLRLAIGHQRTALAHISRAWTLLRQHASHIDAA